jgi:hypothetical protein
MLITRIRTAVAMLCLSIMAAACGGGGGGGGAASSPPGPSQLSYQVPPPLLIGKALATLAPSVQGTVSAYSVAPALPAGLSLDTGSGAISGTPTALTPSAAYTITASGASGSSTSFGLNLEVDSGPTVHLTASASDPNGYPLTFTWKTTDGTLLNTNGAQTDWLLPSGPGLHFAYVLAANGKGGYTERRIGVNTDSIGNPAIATAPQALAAPAQSAPSASAHDYRGFLVEGTPGVQVQFFSSPGGTPFPTTGPVVTDIVGQYIIPNLPAALYTATCSYDGGKTSLACTPGSINAPAGTLVTEDTADVYSFSPVGDTRPFQLSTGVVAASDYFLVASPILAQVPFEITVLQADKSPCGIVDPFFGVSVTVSATLIDAGGNVLAGPITGSKSGIVSIPANAPTSATVKISCEGNPVIAQAMAGLTTGTSVTLPQTAAPVVSMIAATFNGTATGTFLPPPSGQPSDARAPADAFLSEKGLDTRQGTCQYYKAIGAAQGCDTQGNLLSPISFTDWQRAVQIDSFAPAGAKVFQASYVNIWDLNLSRQHHSVSTGANSTAAYVCNHLGPPVTATQADVDQVVDDTVNGKNLVACVAMDYSISPGVNGGKAFVRFLIFGPGGQLLPSVNLDGREEKFVPGTCVVCHGGDRYAGAYPEDGSGHADVGAHFLTYDTANFAFSSKAGLTKADQEEAIYQLNQNVLSANPTPAEVALIAGWYADGTHVLNESYVPAAWAAYAGGVNAYLDMYAHSCRGCHIAQVSTFNFEAASGTQPAGSDYSGPVLLGGTSQLEFWSTVCSSFSGDIGSRPRSMPNSLVTFNRFWSSQGSGDFTDQPLYMGQFFGFDKALAGGVKGAACTTPSLP